MSIKKCQETFLELRLKMILMIELRPTDLSRHEIFLAVGVRFFGALDGLLVLAEDVLEVDGVFLDQRVGLIQHQVAAAGEQGHQVLSTKHRNANQLQRQICSKIEPRIRSDVVERASFSDWRRWFEKENATWERSDRKASAGAVAASRVRPLVIDDTESLRVRTVPSISANDLKPETRLMSRWQYSSTTRTLCQVAQTTTASGAQPLGTVLYASSSIRLFRIGAR